MTGELSELRASIAKLDSAVGDLKIAAAELRTAAHESAVRSHEDRVAAAQLHERVSALERWKARIQGQIALLAFFTGTAVAIIASHIWHIAV